MKIKDDLILSASNALKNSGIIDSDGCYKKEFSGYISSFGAAIAQCGLLPALIFYEGKGNANEDRDKVPAAILSILQSYYKVNIEGKSISKYILSNCFSHDNIVKELLPKVMEAATAIKIALRLYKKIS